MSLRSATVSLIVAVLMSPCEGKPSTDGSWTPGSRVQLISQADGTFTLSRDGEPYFVKGAGVGSGPGLAGGDLALLAASGGNSIRTWGIAQLEAQVDGKRLIDRAHELGITVTAGFWVQHARHGFDYGDAASIERQRARLRKAVLEYRDHPALLAWGLGNEMEAFQPGEIDVRLWQELNHLAGMIKAMDPYHPVVTVVAEIDEPKIAGIRAHYPRLDILGVNAYGSAATVGRRLRESGWEGPYLLTEYGVAGTWEAPQTPWGAPVEGDPGTKAIETYTTYQLNNKDNAGRTLGSYVFFWGSKQEVTSTWFGMFLPSGEKLPRVDAMAYAWSGRWPENRAPKLRSLETPVAFQRVQAGSPSHAVVDCIDREGDALRYAWEIRAESTERKQGGDAESAPPAFPQAIKAGAGTPRIEFRVPSQPGGYRLFVTAFDGKGGAAVHNVPFFVED
jgi:hypothetical protein